jgi:glycosyltransferase involved in cell wall biosynthesis
MTPTDLHVAIDARPLSQRPMGFATIARAMVATLTEAGCRVTLVSDGPLAPHYPEVAGLPWKILPAHGRWTWEQRALRDWLDVERPQVYFAGMNRGLPLRGARHTRCLLGLADVIPWKFPFRYLWAPPRFWTLRREFFPQVLSAWRADHILTISETSARDIRAWLPHQRVTAIPLRLLATPCAPAAERRPCFVYLGGYEVRKRLDVLLTAFARFRRDHPNFRLLLIGGGYEPLAPAIERLGLADAVELPGYVTEAEKQTLLRDSMAIVYPSLYEGYGMAIAEGLLAGTPVVCGRGGAQSEVGRDAVLYIDPTKVDDLTRGMHEVLRPEVRERLLRARKPSVARLLDPEIPRRTLALIQRLAASRAAG